MGSVISLEAKRKERIISDYMRKFVEQPEEYFDFSSLNETSPPKPYVAPWTTPPGIDENDG